MAAAEHPTVSVVVTSYNYGRFLAEAIESVQRQTLAATEIIVVDDGSVDDTAEVAARFPVRYLHQANGGVCRARNHGAAIARGELLMFLDADDVLEPTYLETCARALREAPPDVGYAYTQMRYFGSEEGIHRAGPFSAKSVLRGNLVNASAVIERAAFVQSGGFSLAWARGHEDMELWVRLYSLGVRGVFVPEPLLRYRRHGPSRNTLSPQELRALSFKLWWSYPSLYWTKLAARPIASWRARRD